MDYKKCVYFKGLLYLGLFNFIYCSYPIPSDISKELSMLSSEADPNSSEQNRLSLKMPPPFVSRGQSFGSWKAYSCTRILCYEDTSHPVCACNFNTGNVVTFKNSCDVTKHNCRFDTGFKVILNEVCPWEYQSRRNLNEVELDYSDPKYYNKK